MGTLAAKPCPCGRTLKLLAKLNGRVEDILPLADGRFEFVHPRTIWQIFKSDREVLQYQLTQHEPRRFALRLVTVDESAFQGALACALPELERVLGPGAVVEPTHQQQIERTAGGRFRAVASLCAPRATVTGRS